MREYFFKKFSVRFSHAIPDFGLLPKVVEQSVSPFLNVECLDHVASIGKVIV